MQQQLEGTQQQQQLVQERLRHSSAPVQQAQPSSSALTGNHAYAQPATYQHDQAHDQAQNSHDQAYLNRQAFSESQHAQHDQGAEADMDFEPSGSAKGEPSEDPFGWEGGSDRPENGQDSQQRQQQGQGEDELYTPSLPAEPSGSYMADPSLQRERLLTCYLCWSFLA